MQELLPQLSGANVGLALFAQAPAYCCCYLVPILELAFPQLLAPLLVAGKNYSQDGWALSAIKYNYNV